jgi:hypothetical protein
VPAAGKSITTTPLRHARGVVKNSFRLPRSRRSVSCFIMTVWQKQLNKMSLHTRTLFRQQIRGCNLTSWAAKDIIESDIVYLFRKFLRRPKGLLACSQKANFGQSSGPPKRNQITSQTRSWISTLLPSSNLIQHFWGGIFIYFGFSEKNSVRISHDPVTGL